MHEEEPAVPATLPPGAAIEDGLDRLARTLETNPPEGQATLKALLGQLTLTPMEKKPDAGKGESRSTWAYQVTGSLYLPDILVLIGEKPGSPSVVAGTGFEPVTFGL